MSRKDRSSKPGRVAFSGGKVTTYESTGLGKQLGLDSGYCPLIDTSKRALTAAMLMPIAFPVSAWALPTGWNVVHGDVTFQQSGKNLNIRSRSNKAIVNYQQFNIAADEMVDIHLPSASASILNRILGGGRTNIQGILRSNGEVLLVNPAGFTFGSAAQVQVGSLIASTLAITNADYLAGRYLFQNDTANPGSSIINEGNIQTAAGGSVVLIGSAVQNTGNITAPGGKVHLAVGDQVHVAVAEGIITEVTVDEALKDSVEAVDAAIENQGAITANHVNLQTQLAHNAYAQAINNTGRIEATGVEFEGGSIVFTGGGDAGQGIVVADGEMVATASQDGQQAPLVDIRGGQIWVEGTIEANGQNGVDGGNINIVSEDLTVLNEGSSVSARGIGADSDGGEIFIWSDGDTYFQPTASLDVSGGDISGDGGFVEVSGKERVFFQGQAYGGATDGQAGSILIDPTDIIISSTGPFDTVTQNIPAPGWDEAAADHAGQAVNFDPSVGGSFNGFGDITLQATRDIIVNSDFDTSLAAAGDLTTPVALNLDAGRNLNINADITTHNANITLTSESDGGTSGVLRVNGNVTSHGGDIFLRGNQMDINQSVDAGTGTISMEATRNNRAITVFSGSDNGDSGSRLHISTAELGRMKAADVEIGSSSNTNTITVGGNVDINGTPTVDGGAFDLTLKNGGNVSISNRAYDLGSNEFNIEAGGNVTINTNANNRPVHISNISGNTINIRTQRNNSDIQIDGNLSANSDLLLRTDRTGSDVNIGGNASAGRHIRIEPRNSTTDINIGGNLTQTGSGYVYLHAAANPNSHINIDGTMSLMGASNQDFTIYSGNGNVFQNSFFDNGTATFRRINLRTYANNADLTVGGNLTATDYMRLYTHRSNSDVILTGNLQATNDLDVRTYQTFSDISGTATLTSTNRAVNLRAYQTDSTINYSGNINARTGSLIYTQRDRATITTGGDINVTHGGVTFESRGRNSGININGDVTARNRVYAYTRQTDSAITANADFTSTTNNVEFRTDQLRSGISVTGDVTAQRLAQAYARRNDSPITMVGDWTSNTRNVNILADYNNSDISFTGDIDAATSAVVRATRANSDVTVVGDITTGTGDLTVQTSNIESDVNVTGDLTSGRRLYVRTYNTNSDITQHSGTWQSTDLTDVRAEGNTSHITLHGDIDAGTSGSVYARRTGGTIHYTGDLTSGTTFLLRTAGNDGHITMDGSVLAGTTLTLQTVTNSGYLKTNQSELSASANGNLNLYAQLDIDGADARFTADADGNNSGLLYSNRVLDTENGDLTLAGSQIRIRYNIDAGTGTVFLLPTVDKAIRVANSTDHQDNGSRLDISTPELNRITAERVQIGDRNHTGNLTINGTIDLNGSAAGDYHLDLETGGDITSTNRIFNPGNHTLNLSAGGNVNVTTSTNGRDIVLNNVTGDNVLLQTTGAGSDLLQPSGTWTANHLTVATNNGTVGTSGTALNTAADELTLNTTNDVYINNTGNMQLNAVTLPGTLDISSTGGLSIGGDVQAATVNLGSVNGDLRVDQGDITAISNLTLGQQGTGTFILENGHQVSHAGDITLNVDNINLSGGTVNSGGTVKITPATTSRTIYLGQNGSGLDIRQSDLDAITATDLEIGDDTHTGGMILGSAELDKDLTLNTQGNILDSSPLSDTYWNLVFEEDHSLTITGRGGPGAGQVGRAGAYRDLDVWVSGLGDINVDTIYPNYYINAVDQPPVVASTPAAAPAVTPALPQFNNSIAGQIGQNHQLDFKPAKLPRDGMARRPQSISQGLGTAKVSVDGQGSTGSVASGVSTDTSAVEAYGGGAVDADPMPLSGKLFALQGESNSVRITEQSSGRLITDVPLDGKPSGLTVEPSMDRAFVTMQDTPRVAVINTETHQVMGYVETGNGPRSVAVDPNQDKGFVANSQDHTVTVFTPSTLQVVDTIAVGNQPVKVAAQSELGVALVANEGDGTLSRLNTQTGEVDKTIPVGDRPVDVAFGQSPEQSSVAYVVLQGENRLAVVDAEAGEVIKTIEAGSNPYSVRTNPQGQVFVGRRGNSSVLVLNGSGLTPEYAIGQNSLSDEVPGVPADAIESSTPASAPEFNLGSANDNNMDTLPTLMWMMPSDMMEGPANFSQSESSPHWSVDPVTGHMSHVDGTADLQFEGSIRTPIEDPLRKQVWIPHFEDGVLSAVDQTSGEVQTVVETGNKPVSVDQNPKTGVLAVANYGSGTVSLVNPEEGVVEATVDVGSRPRSVGFSPDGQVLYVSVFGENTLKVLDGQTGEVLSVHTVPSEPTELSVNEDGMVRLLVESGRRELALSFA